jgi:hypothetical protein
MLKKPDLQNRFLTKKMMQILNYGIVALRNDI